MKSILIAIIACTIFSSSFAQSEKYMGAMQKNLFAMSEAKTPETMLAVVNSFERIANAEKTQWLPFYYASLAQVWYSFMLNDPRQNDVLSDKADQWIAKAEEISPGNSEIVMLKAMYATLRMMVDPMNRYMKYGMLSGQLIEESKKLDPTNPRPFMWQAQGLVQTPEQFGGGCAKAKPVFEEAIKRYETFQPASAIAPNWGKEQALEAYNKCN